VFAVTAGVQVACYGGPAGTQGKGVCVAGKQTCDDKGVLGACLGAVVPGLEQCNGLDDSCDGLTDEGCKAQDFVVGYAASRLQGSGPTYSAEVAIGRNFASGKATGAGATAAWWGFWRWYKGVLP